MLLPPLNLPHFVFLPINKCDSKYSHICVINFRKTVGKSNPYKKFFKTPPERAAIWRTLPPLSLDEMDMKQKADAITERVSFLLLHHASNFDLFPCFLDRHGLHSLDQEHRRRNSYSTRPYIDTEDVWGRIPHACRHIALCQKKRHTLFD